MTNAELSAALAKLDPSLPVVVFNFDSGAFETIRTVELGEREVLIDGEPPVHAVLPSIELTL